MPRHLPLVPHHRLVVVLALLCGFAWLNLVGLPDFLKTRLVAALHERGVELEFTRMRLRPMRGLVIDNVRIGSTNSVSNPSLAIAEIQLRLDHAALWHRQLQLEALTLRNGKLTLPFAPTNVSPSALTVDGINARLQFQTNDTWTLDHFSANFAGANILINAEIQHGSELRNLEIFHAKKNGRPGAWQARLKKISDTLEKIHFVGKPEIELAVTGDAPDLKTFVLRLDARAPATETPWGSAKNVVLAAEAKPLHDGWLPQLKLDLSALNTDTSWGSLHHATLALQTETAPAGKIPPTVFYFQSDAANSRWGSARKINFDAQLSANPDSPTNADAVARVVDERATIQIEMDGKIRAVEVERIRCKRRCVWRFLGFAGNCPHQFIRRTWRRTIGCAGEIKCRDARADLHQ